MTSTARKSPTAPLMVLGLNTDTVSLREAVKYGTSATDAAIRVKVALYSVLHRDEAPTKAEAAAAVSLSPQAVALSSFVGGILIGIVRSGATLGIVDARMIVKVANNKRYGNATKIRAAFSDLVRFDTESEAVAVADGAALLAAFRTEADAIDTKVTTDRAGVADAASSKRAAAPSEGETVGMVDTSTITVRYATLQAAADAACKILAASLPTDASEGGKVNAETLTTLTDLVRTYAERSVVVTKRSTGKRTAHAA